MGCLCDKDAIAAAARQLFYMRLAQALDGRTVTLSGSGGWWTGTWNGVKWSGERYMGRGTVATVVATGEGSFHIEVGYTLANLGTWEDIYGDEDDE